MSFLLLLFAVALAPVDPRVSPAGDADEPFLMPVESVFARPGGEVVVTGRVERGTVEVGDEVEVVGILPTSRRVVVSIEMFRKLLTD